MIRRLAVALFVLTVLVADVTSTAQEYTIGPGDILKIIVWGHDDLSKDYPVTLDGRVPFPLIGGVQAAGLSTSELARRLRDLLEKDYLVNPQVIVSVKDYLSSKVHVLGEAEKPGLFYLTGPTTLLEMLSKAGGLARSAGKDLVLVRTEGGKPGDASAVRSTVLLRFDLRKIQAGDVKENVLLQNGDMMFVPKASAFFVLGEVNKPGTFPLDKEIAALEAVTLAGGFSNTAAPSGAKVLRRTAEGKQETISIDLSVPSPATRISGWRTATPSWCPRATPSSSSGRCASRAPISSTRRQTCWRASPSRAGSPTRPRPAARGSSAPPTRGSRRSPST